MKCPRCGEAMTEGILMGSRGESVCWFSKEYRRKHAFPPMTKKAVKESGLIWLKTCDGITTPQNGYFVCKKCGILMAELPYIKEAADVE